MSTFTVELREIEPEFNDAMKDYPIFQDEYKPLLTQKIFNHFYYREIGHETIEMFMFQLRKKMHEIMPLYNKLYESELLRFEPIANYDLTSDYNSESESKGETSNESKGTTESGSDNKSRVVVSETPQVRLSGDADYATAATDTYSHTDTDSTAKEVSQGASQGRGSARDHSRVIGYSGVSGAALLQEYRAALLNIDLMVIDEVEELFMGLWNTSEEYSEHAARWPLFGMWGYPL